MQTPQDVHCCCGCQSPSHLGRDCPPIQGQISIIDGVGVTLYRGAPLIPGTPHFPRRHSPCMSPHLLLQVPGRHGRSHQCISVSRPFSVHGIKGNAHGKDYACHPRRRRTHLLYRNQTPVSQVEGRTFTSWYDLG